MVFSTSIFLFAFLPLFLGIYFTVPRPWHNRVLLAFSLVFYGWWSPKYLALIFASAFVNYFFALLIHNSSGSPPAPYRRKIFLWTCIVFNLLLLGFFKYAGFFLESAFNVLKAFKIEANSSLNILLPIGISFFTFQGISYVVDVYRGEAKPLRSFHDFLLYIAMFPHQLAGPIVRFHEISDQLFRRSTDLRNFQEGMGRFAIGLFKKVIIADSLAPLVDFAFDPMRGDLTMASAWPAVVLFSLQIYFDFSGYSDMAIGLAKIMGFTFPENFKYPYLSLSITEFWRRWHMTLSRFLKDYVYIPLGGNRKGIKKQYMYLMMTMALGGLWHGAGWTFILWGCYHGLLLSLEKYFGKFFKAIRITFLARIYFLIATLIGWTLFRSTDLDSLFKMGKGLFGVHGLGTFADAAMVINLTTIIPLGLGLALAFAWHHKLLELFGVLESIQSIHNGGIGKVSFQILLTIALLAISFWQVLDSTYRPFIYFQF